MRIFLSLGWDCVLKIDEKIEVFQVKRVPHEVQSLDVINFQSKFNQKNLAVKAKPHEINRCHILKFEYIFIDARERQLTVRSMVVA